MGFDTGTGIALGTVAVSIAAVLISVVKARVPKTDKDCTVCLEHSGVVAGIRNIESTTKRLEEGQQEIFQDIKKLLQK